MLALDLIITPKNEQNFPYLHSRFLKIVFTQKHKAFIFFNVFPMEFFRIAVKLNFALNLLLLLLILASKKFGSKIQN